MDAFEEDACQMVTRKGPKQPGSQVGGPDRLATEQGGQPDSQAARDLL